MALTQSTMFPLGNQAPTFTLPDTVSGTTVSLDELAGSVATVVMFICNHCPYVKHIDQGLLALVKDYQNDSVRFIAISSNDVNQFPEDAPDQMAQTAQHLGYPFPYLYDSTQAVARAYQAACTPDFYVFDASLLCVYRGRMDAATPGNGIPVTGADLRTALDAVTTGDPVNPDQQPSMGCNIKWKADQ